LIISFNTPLPNVAWKVFPTIFCGNAAVLKPSEDTPASAWIFAEIAQDCGLPPGVLNVVQGLGPEAGAALVEHPDVDLVSFTGSSATGRWINETAGRRLAKVCLELGGKNALVVCDDADLENAVRWACASAFSNAGQRCAAASRIVVFDAVYDEFRGRFVAAAAELDDVGPVISERSLDRMIAAIEGARATIAAGGRRLDRPGWHLAPTILENVAIDADASCTELFGPVTILYRVDGFDEALALVNDSPYGLTAAIHTQSLHRAMRFADKVQAGVVVVNGGTHGSEPHMGFGGVKNSGTGWREAGIEALDVYSEWKYVNLIADPAKA
jgi:aldehyde dehydrogenase (NAD+)